MQSERALEEVLDDIRYGAISESVVETLKQAIKSVNAFDRMPILKKNTPFGTILHHFSGLGCTAAVECIITSVPKRWLLSFYSMINEYGATCLHCAFSGSGDENIVKMVLCSIEYCDRLELLSIQDCMKNTALHIAAEKGKAKSIHLALSLLQPHQRTKILSLKNLGKETVLDVKCSIEVTATFNHFLKMSSHSSLVKCKTGRYCIPPLVESHV